jgi:vacuolar-type H+-ATPase subunit E/Vma4
MTDDAPEAETTDSPITTEQVDEAKRRAEQIVADARAEAERLRADAQVDADKTREDARAQAEALLNEIGEQLADMADAYREAIREARKAVHLMADGIRDAARREPG